MTISEFRIKCCKELENYSPSAQLDTDVFLQHFLLCDKTYLLFHGEKEIPEDKIAAISNAVSRRKTGLPVAYIIGYKEFYGYDFYVTPEVLIPKPDTEILVENTLVVIKEKLRHKDSIAICDMCTGSGCVALSIVRYALDSGIANLNSFSNITLADISNAALNIAKKNAIQLLPDLTKKADTPLSFVETNLFENITQKFDIIVSNPPYIPAEEARNLLLDGRSEPILALDGDININGHPTGANDGLGIIRNLVPQAKFRLEKDGIILLETGEYNAEKTAEILETEGYTAVRTYKDLEGQLRNVVGKVN